jgi:hypothetical protein
MTEPIYWSRTALKVSILCNGVTVTSADSNSDKSNMTSNDSSNTVDTVITNNNSCSSNNGSNSSNNNNGSNRIVSNSINSNGSKSLVISSSSNNNTGSNSSSNRITSTAIIPINKKLPTQSAVERADRRKLLKNRTLKCTACNAG